MSVGLTDSTMDNIGPRIRLTTDVVVSPRTIVAMVHEIAEASSYVELNTTGIVTTAVGMKYGLVEHDVIKACQGNAVFTHGVSSDCTINARNGNAFSKKFYLV